MVSTGTSPASVIRDYLAQEGTAEVPFHHLLTTWNVEEPTSLDRQEMVAALGAAGVKSSHPLGDLAPDDVVTLSLSAPALASAPPAWFDDSRPRVGMPVGAVPPAPPQAPSQPAAPGGRRWLRIALVVAGVLLLVAGASTGAFFLGQDTRLSDAQVDAKLDRLAAHDKRVHSERAERSLASQKRTLTRQRRKAASAAEKRGQQSGYASGQDAGYTSGSAAGYSSGRETGKEEGREAGVDEGMEKASDELSCSDDLDVPLPPCP